MAKLQYKGKEVDLTITTGALYRFERAGFSMPDFGDPRKQLQAQVELVRACIDPKAPADVVADGLPSIAVLSEAIVTAIDESGIAPDVDDDEAEAGEGNG